MLCTPLCVNDGATARFSMCKVIGRFVSVLATGDGWCGAWLAWIADWTFLVIRLRIAVPPELFFGLR